MKCEVSLGDAVTPPEKFRVPLSAGGRLVFGSPGGGRVSARALTPVVVGGLRVRSREKVAQRAV